MKAGIAYIILCILHQLFLHYVFSDHNMLQQIAISTSTTFWYIYTLDHKKQKYKIQNTLIQNTKCNCLHVYTN